MGSISPARLAAFKILLAVECRQSHSDDLLRGKAVSALSPADRNLATALVLGTLRWQIRLDEQFRPLMKRPLARLDPEVSIALRMGAFQLLHLDRIPARAAIDESVELTKLAGHRFASGMVNAVLRKLSDEAGGPTSDLLDESAEQVAVSRAHPRWMVERWAEFYGLEAARAICNHGQAAPRLAVRVSAPEAEAELAGKGVELEPSALLSAAWEVVRGDVAATKAFRKGRVRAQDEGSQLVGEIAARAGLDLHSAKIIDLCAAPGGKTLILAERIPKAQIVAYEASAERLARMQERLSAFRGPIECQLGDAAALKAEAEYDLVLADVPCSGTGTLGRNPEIRHRLKPEDLPRQAERQRRILAAALRAVRPGGRVVYSTCSLEPEENEQVIAAVLSESANARPVSLEATMDAMARDGVLVSTAVEKLRAQLTPEGALRLLPGAFGTDGFFVALLERAG